MATHSEIREKTDEGLKAYKKAVSYEPEHAEVYNNTGNALQEQDKLGEAIKAYNKAVSFKPDFAEAHHNLSTIKNIP